MACAGRSFQTVIASTAPLGRIVRLAACTVLDEQAVDLTGDRAAGRVAVVGEGVVALPAARDRGQQASRRSPSPMPMVEVVTPCAARLAATRAEPVGGR